MGFPFNFLGPVGMATMGDGRPDNSPEDLSSLTNAYGAARASRLTPNGHVADAFSSLSNQPQAYGGLNPQSLLGYAQQQPEAPGAPSNPVSAGGSNATDEQAGPEGPTSVGGAPLPGGWQGPHSVGGAPLPGQYGVTPQPAAPDYNLGQRLRNAAGFFTNQGAGNLFAPQAAQQQPNGPGLIQSFMNYIHTKAGPSSF